MGNRPLETIQAQDSTRYAARPGPTIRLYTLQKLRDNMGKSGKRRILGYETLRHQLESSSTRFFITDPRMRTEIKIFLSNVQSWLPLETPSAVTE